MEKIAFCHCGGPLEYVETEGQVCKTCGTIEDSSYLQLVSHHEPHSSIPHQATLRNTRNNWHLAGQSKEARRRANTLEVHRYIDGLACALHASGLSARAKNIFDYAMSAGCFRWGRKAQLVAGAALSLALRESKRPGSLPDIARILNESNLQALVRIVSTVKSILGLDLVTNDSHAYIITLNGQVAKAIQEAPASADSPELLPTHRAILKSIDLDAMLVTGRSLLDLLGRQPSTSPDLSPASTACAAFLYAVEAESRATVSQIPQLAGFIARHCNIGKETVVRRYQALEAPLLNLTERLPWLDRYEKPTSRSSRVAKRLVIARGLKDVTEWQQDIWIKNLERNRPPTPAFHDDDEAGGAESSMGGVPHLRPAKRRRRNPLGDAKRFLLDPQNAPLPAVTKDEENSSADLPMAAYVLAGPADSCQKNEVPSRLQLLTVARGGSSADEIQDEELFEVDEFENMLRSDEEKKSFLHFWAMNEGDTASAVTPKPRREKREKEKTTRINAEAAARFFEAENPFDSKDDDIVFGWEDEEYDDYTCLGEGELGIGWPLVSPTFHDGYQEEI